MINDNLLWTADEYEAVVDYKANGIIELMYY